MFRTNGLVRALRCSMALRPELRMAPLPLRSLASSVRLRFSFAATSKLRVHRPAYARFLAKQTFLDKGMVTERILQVIKNFEKVQTSLERSGRPPVTAESSDEKPWAISRSRWNLPRLRTRRSSRKT
eukprot:scaffold3323_cov279-Pinguiococcus_pyrenoidosus.AAC.9